MNMNGNFTWINGEYVPFNQSNVPVSDLIIQRGYGIFDFFLVWLQLTYFLIYLISKNLFLYLLL